MGCGHVAQLCLKPETVAMSSPLPHVLFTPKPQSDTLLAPSSKNHGENLALVVLIPSGIMLDQVLLFSKYLMKICFPSCPYPIPQQESARRDDLPDTHIFSEHHGSRGFTI